MLRFLVPKHFGCPSCLASFIRSWKPQEEDNQKPSLQKLLEQRDAKREKLQDRETSRMQGSLETFSQAGHLENEGIFDQYRQLFDEK